MVRQSRWKYTVIHTFSFRAVHAFSEGRDTGIPARAASRVDGGEVLGLVNNFRQPGFEGLDADEGTLSLRRSVNGGGVWLGV